VPNFNGAHLRSPGFEIQTQRVEAEDLDCNLPNWLGLYAYAESSPRCIAGNFSRRSITLESSTDNVVKRKRIDHHLDLSKLAPGEEIVLSPVLNCNEDVSLGTVMSVVLTYPRMNSITMTCLWYRDNEPSGEMPDVRLAATAAKEIDGKCNAQHLVERESRVVMA
jgi:hypothetical protein